MLDLATVTADIARWIETFVEVPHPALGGWAPCPYCLLYTSDAADE